MKPLAITLAALGLVGIAAAPAAATTTQTDTMTITVKTGDLDLASPQGQKTLDQRVEKAARTVCRTTSVTTGSRVRGQEAHDCLVKARADVRRQVAALTGICA